MARGQDAQADGAVRRVIPTDENGNQVQLLQRSAVAAAPEAPKAVSLDRTRVTVTVPGEGSSVLSLPTMESTTAVSELSLMLDHGELIERSYKLRDRRGFQNNAVLYSMGVPHGDAGRMHMYESLWSSLDQLETYMYKAAEYNKWHETTLMARLGGFHALGAMSSVRAMVGGDVMEFGICLTVEVVAGGTFVSLSYCRSRVV